MKIQEGFKYGAILALKLATSYMLSVTFFLIAMALIYLDFSLIGLVPEFMEFIFLIGLMAGSIPAMLIGGIGGAAISAAYHLIGHKVSTITAVTFGIIVGLIIVLSIHVLFWPTIVNVFPVSLTSPKEIVSTYLYHWWLVLAIPSLITILALGWLSWRLNPS
jgi:hypothetical protein